MSDILDTFNKIPTPQRVLILLLVMILMSVLFYMLVYTDIEAEIKKQQDTERQLVTQQVDIERKLANKEEIMGELDELKLRKEKLEKVLPKKAEIPSLLQKIYGQAKIVGLEIQHFEPGKEAPKGLYTEIPVEMELRGTYDEVADFFYYIGRMERIVNIKNMAMQRTTAGPFGTSGLRVSCEAITYRSAPPKPAGKPGGKPATPPKK